MKRKPKADPRMEPGYQRAVDEFVRREVVYCVSQLISELAQKPEYMDDLSPVLSQDDYENAALEWKGTEWRPDFRVRCGQKAGPSNAAIFYWRDHKSDDAESGPFDTERDAWENVCQQYSIDPFQTEAYEHWIVSPWLADKLESHGEMILRDFMGLTIWGRTCTGQSISMDSVIQSIYEETKQP